MLQKDEENALTVSAGFESPPRPGENGPVERLKSAGSVASSRRAALGSEPKYFDEIVKPETLEDFLGMIEDDLQVSFKCFRSLWSIYMRYVSACVFGKEQQVRTFVGSCKVPMLIWGIGLSSHRSRVQAYAPMPTATMKNDGLNCGL
jgi:hypothetical protein